MHIVADENIPLVKQAFSHLGEVHTVAGRHLQPAQLANAEILLVRSITQVNQTLLANSPVRFVGTATIGVEHIDQAYLQQQGIGFASAPGCNAIAAAEYVISALLLLAEQQEFDLADKIVGIIGCGNVGSRVLTRLEALGVQCLVYDPPLQARQGNTQDFVTWTTLLTADIITLHVPLTSDGDYPTWHLVNAATLTQLKPDAILINAARGAVLDETALLEHLARQSAFRVLLDVWNNEPAINLQLLPQVHLATPHIAGYSLEGKLRGTAMLYAAVCTFLQQSSKWQLAQHLPESPVTALHCSAQMTDMEVIRLAARSCYDPRRDDAQLRRVLQVSDKSQFFDQLRKNYPVRREFSSLTVGITAARTQLARQLTGLGFKLK